MSKILGALRAMFVGVTCAGLIFGIGGPARAASICAAFHGSLAYGKCPHSGQSIVLTSNGKYMCQSSSPYSNDYPEYSLTGVTHINGGGAANGGSGSFAAGDVVSFSWSNVKNSSGPLTAKFNDLNLPNGIIILSVAYPNIAPKYTFSAASADYFTVSEVYAGNANFQLNWSCSGP